jgi:signal transduction histidine kinase
MTSTHLLHTSVAEQSESAEKLLAGGLESYAQAKLEQALDLLERARVQASAEKAWQVQAQALVALGRVYRDLGEPNKALVSLDSALELAQDHHDSVIESDALNLRAGVNHLLGEYALALKDLGLSLGLAKHAQDERRTVNTLINMGILSTKLADYPRALTLFSDAHKMIRETLQDRTLEGQCLVNLALLYEDMGNNNKALETCQLAKETVSGLDNRVLEAITTVNLGYAHKRLSNMEAARQNFEEALALAKTIKFSKVEIAALDGLGQLFTSLGDTTGAVRLHQEALERSRENNDSESELDALLNLGRDFLAAQQAQQSLEVLTEALALAQKTQRKKSVLEAHELLASAFETLGELQEALAHFRSFHTLEKALFNEEREKKTRQLSIQFDVERARYETEVYRIRTEIEREAREKAETTVRERTKQLLASHQTIEQQHQALEQKVIELHQLLGQNEVLRERLILAAKRNTTLNERSLRRLSAELHDGPAQDLGFALIKLGSGEIDKTAQTLEGESREKYNQELEVIYSSIARALNEMRAIAGGMCLPELEHLSLSETLQRAARSHQRRTQSDVAVLLGPSLETVDAPLPVKMTLYRVVQESLMNAFKHGGGKAQRVTLEVRDDDLGLEVSDGGPGFEVEAAFLGNRLGLAGMRERVESLGGQFAIQSTGQGTTVHARLPFIHTDDITEMDAPPPTPHRHRQSVR